MDCESIFSYLYSDKYDWDEYDSCAFDNDWKYTDKAKGEEYVKISANDMDIDDDKLDEDEEEDYPNVNDNDSVDKDMKRDQASQDNNIDISNDVTISENSFDNQDPDSSDSNGVSDNCSDDPLTEDVLRAQPLARIFRALRSKQSNKGFDESAWGGDLYPMIASMIIVNDMGVRIKKQYF